MGTTIESQRQVNPKDRMILTRFVFKDSEHELARGERAWYALELATVHDRGRKEYHSRARRVEVTERGWVRYTLLVGAHETPAPLTAVRVPADRYSAKTLDALHTDFESAAASADVFASLVSWATVAQAAEVPA
ncbi:hypothetical protein [Leifsonia shinshuensis]